MATTTYGTPYVSGTDLVANWPAASLTVADAIDAAGYYVGRGINTQTASYTGVLTDAGKTITMSNAGATTFTVPANSSVAYPTGTRINILNLGAGACTPTAGAGVTISGTISALATNQGAAVVKTATNTWSYLTSAFPASGTATVATNEGTTSATFAALATAGPAVTVVTGTKALVIVSAMVYNTSASGRAFMSAAVSGATTLAATDARAFAMQASAGAGSVPQNGGSWASIITGLTAGSNTFTAQYRTQVAGGATFSERNITVIDMGS